MRAVILVLYIAMSAWLLISAALRVALQLSAGISLDALPFISGGIAVVALLALAPAYDELRGRREHHDQITTSPGP